MKILQNAKTKLLAVGAILGSGSALMAAETLQTVGKKITSDWYTVDNITRVGGAIAIVGAVIAIMGVYKAVTSDGDIKESVGKIAGGLIVAVTGMNLIAIIGKVAPDLLP